MGGVLICSPPQLRDLQPRYFVNVPSRPLWHTMDQSPVLILGGFPDKKSILLTDTNFKDFSLVQVGVASGLGMGAASEMLRGLGVQTASWSCDCIPSLRGRGPGG